MYVLCGAIICFVNDIVSMGIVSVFHFSNSLSFLSSDYVHEVVETVMHLYFGPGAWRPSVAYHISTIFLTAVLFSGGTFLLSDFPSVDSRFSSFGLFCLSSLFSALTSSSPTVHYVV